MSNKLFISSNVLKNQSVSKVKYNREYLISNEIADELNMYNTFGIFSSFNDVYEPKYKPNDKEKTAEEEFVDGFGQDLKLGVKATRSIFNKYSAVLTGASGEDPKKASAWRISNNVPLMDSVYNRNHIRENSGCTVKELVRASESGILGPAMYSYSDFMYCKHLGKIPNNYMITLRRFPMPVDDFISSVGIGGRHDRKGTTSTSLPSLGCMVTWLGVSGNDMNNILKYSMKMPFEYANARWEEDSTDADSHTGFLNSVAAMFDKKYQYQYATGQAGTAFNSYLGKMFGSPGSNPYNVRDYSAWRDDRRVYGPIDAIKGTYKRSDAGLEFEQSFTLTFEYELRSYNGINGRQAMLDLLSNILNVTYTTGTFWGGGYRSVGAHQNNIFANMEIFNKKGNTSFTGFLDSFANDLSSLKGSVSNYFSNSGGLGKGILDFLNNLGGMFMGNMLNKLGRPAKVMVNSLLSPAPVGFWHVTIGNPHHPIMSIGNMIVTNATVEHTGPLGLDDFPTGLKVTVELSRGKPRDIKDIEKLYMHGNDRIYSNMGPKITDMYQHAKESRNRRQSNNADSNNDPFDKTTINSMNAFTLSRQKDIYIKYFGTNDTTKIETSAKEQDFGSSPANNK